MEEFDVKDLKPCDIIVCDYSWLMDGRSKDVRYVVMLSPNGKKVAISFHGNCNDNKTNEGWYDLMSLPFALVAVYRPKLFGQTFIGDLENKEHYELIYQRRRE